eukprot:5940396-Prymnesium_polylepis.2
MNTWRARKLLPLPSPNTACHLLWLRTLPRLRPRRAVARLCEIREPRVPSIHVPRPHVPCHQPVSSVRPGT